MPTFMHCYQTNPAAIRQTVTLLALFLHLGPYARQAIAETEKAMAEIDGVAKACDPGWVSLDGTPAERAIPMLD